ncbi:hypothetical protein AMAG_19021 [Allomyces macrogynus ATCC 38327]|uniref:Uncharacterized protein n=1 Tax=Allomyces macrogynus (strain ATCC 38327) TaxID=578462 RepID=A0A0L0SMG6_ALLM3|nr:hypothetical protein AMAG_19021 [Allomyces macrogynus ATCC 38327]|eukprot:KNE63575.1 hypothetical protein AMAG_19021 [Allomyces macrogynus ATCC 38327]
MAAEEHRRAMLRSLDSAKNTAPPTRAGRPIAPPTAVPARASTQKGQKPGGFRPTNDLTSSTGSTAPPRSTGLLATGFLDHHARHATPAAAGTPYDWHPTAASAPGLSTFNNMHPPPPALPADPHVSASAVAATVFTTAPAAPRPPTRPPVTPVTGRPMTPQGTMAQMGIMAAPPPPARPATGIATAPSIAAVHPFQHHNFRESQLAVDGLGRPPQPNSPALGMQWNRPPTPAAPTVNVPLARQTPYVAKPPPPPLLPPARAEPSTPGPIEIPDSDDDDDAAGRNGATANNADDLMWDLSADKADAVKAVHEWPIRDLWFGKYKYPDPDAIRLQMDGLLRIAVKGALDVVPLLWTLSRPDLQAFEHFPRHNFFALRIYKTVGVSAAWVQDIEKKHKFDRGVFAKRPGAVG